MKTVFLVSSSPRRAELLRRAGIRFETFQIHFPSEIESNTIATTDSIGDLVESNARRKLNYAFGLISVDGILLCADTVVAVEGEILGKPTDAKDASRMLRLLSAKEHFVYSGVALADTANCGIVSFHESTKVKFRALSDEEIQKYIATGEPFDKAGAYGIQEMASTFVESISGCYSNVVGLPVAHLTEILRDKMGLDITQHWKQKR